MTTLGDFGGGVDEDAVEVEQAERSTPGTRCEAVVGDGSEAGTSVRRCQNKAGSRRSLCHIHRETETVKTVASPARKLLSLAGRRAGQCRARKQSGGGGRCQYSTTATDTTCQMHRNTEPENFADLEDGELDQREIAAALEAVDAATGGE